MSKKITQLTEDLFVHHGCVNVGILKNGDHALLIDCGDGDLKPTLDQLGIKTIDQIIVTHHHRDSISALDQLKSDHTKIGAPKSERDLIENVEKFWNDPKFRWHLYNYHPHNLMLSESVSISEIYEDRDTFFYNSVKITAIETPGHTGGSLSFLIETDGKKIIFSGDLIYGHGKIWDLYSLQKGNGTTDYHGFLGDRKRLSASLIKLLDEDPDLLIPTHGNLISDPKSAVELLTDRIDKCYDRYLAISALRHYMPDKFPYLTDRKDHLPIREGLEVPKFLRHFGTTWTIISENSEAFVMDCGGKYVINELEKMINDREISGVTEFWITHYHDDHVDAVSDFQIRFPCMTRTDSIVASVIEDPMAFRLPCISPAIAKIDHRTENGDTWRWNEFKMTAFHFPGQTFYHGGLLVEGRGVKLFFSGDSFTMSGIDDYCSGNRNFLGENVGYRYCLDLIEKLRPTHIFNCHVDPAFDFTADQITMMKENLTDREKIYGDLLAWKHPNYGIDEQWIRSDPYEQRIRSGETADLSVVFTNHSDHDCVAKCRPNLPKNWKIEIDENEAIIPPKSEGSISFRIDLPKNLSNGRFVIPISIVYDGRSLGQFREAIFEVFSEE